MPPDKNRVEIKNTKEHTPKNKIDKRTVYDILNQICNDTGLYLHVKQYKPRRNCSGAFYANHSRWLGRNHANTLVSEAEAVLQATMYDEEMKAWSWEKYVSWHVNYYLILENIKEYGYQGLDPRKKVCHLLNGIWCNKLLTTITTAAKHSDKYEKDLDGVIVPLEYIDKQGLR